LEKLSVRKDALSTLTVGFNGGIFNGPKFVRNYVDSNDLGVPFITGSSLLLADLSDLPRLSKRDANSKELRHLKIELGMSLITCSGTIGKMAYGRPEMENCWSSQDILKVVPDRSKILPGYLFAFLSSKFGIPLMTSGTYGAVIQHLEPAHIASCPVPRIGAKREKEIHDLVEQAAQLRSRASASKAQAIGEFEKLSGLPPSTPFYEYARPLIGVANSSVVGDRMDCTYFAEPYVEARTAFDNASSHGKKVLGRIAEIYVPTIFKREYSSDPAFGHPYITGAEVFCATPTSTEFLLRRVADEHRLVLKEGMIVVHEAGQRYGLIGRSVMIGKGLDGFACTNNMVRIVPLDDADMGYIFSVLSSEYGIRLLKREAAGSSIPHLDKSRVQRIEIPWLSKEKRVRISEMAVEARDGWHRASVSEAEAQAKLARAIEGD
jgi:type I restriction enzyme S subunit